MYPERSLPLKMRAANDPLELSPPHSPAPPCFFLIEVGANIAGPCRFIPPSPTGPLAIPRKSAVGRRKNLTTPLVPHTLVESGVGGGKIADGSGYPSPLSPNRAQ